MLKNFDMMNSNAIIEYIVKKKKKIFFFFVLFQNCSYLSMQHQNQKRNHFWFFAFQTIINGPGFSNRARAWAWAGSWPVAGPGFLLDRPI